MDIAGILSRVPARGMVTFKRLFKNQSARRMRLPASNASGSRIHLARSIQVTSKNLILERIA
ncbi:hypothetical protein LPB67_01915 [Undibacterium sp. Jales W-56]|uniref:hypothetical protein n=1 Tax=Undibacterium sp. Jales W-56 TaxID=2897325 RepID=UPI0021D05E90|nr:hypothetical protein [Undibacterium sp. Jales W-56]MCU6432534.1 hypothetical protein [Undibacterium sp. Jales W-56]